MSGRVILLCYDGSVDARTAVSAAAALLPAEHATVLTVWEGLDEVLARTRAGGASTALDIDEIDAAGEQAAQMRAQEGVELARQAGLTAEPRIKKRAGAVWETVLAVADELDVGVIVLGSRGRTGLRALLGSVSHSVLQHASRPVLVIPSEQVAARRRERRH
jgi:nucleotide-binding universal stress UspA family protein